MKSKTECSLVLVECQPFHKVVVETKAGQLEASAYAIEAVKILNEHFEPAQYTDLDGGDFDANEVSGQIFKSCNSQRKQHWLRSSPSRHSGRLGDDNAFGERTSLSNRMRSVLPTAPSVFRSSGSQSWSS